MIKISIPRYDEEVCTYFYKENGFIPKVQIYPSLSEAVTAFREYWEEYQGKTNPSWFWEVMSDIGNVSWPDWVFSIDDGELTCYSDENDDEQR